MKIILLVIIFFSVEILHPQEVLNIAALHRYSFSRNDTVYQFYASKPTRKFNINDKKIYYWYSGDTIVMTQSGYNGKLLNGIYSVTYPNKNLKEQGMFKYGLRNGVWKSWTPDGQLQSVITYDNGVMKGRNEEYENGKIKKSGSYRNSLFTGYSIERDNTGKEHKMLYRHGELLLKSDSADLKPKANAAEPHKQ